MTHRALTPNLIPLTRASRSAPQASSEIRAPLRPQAPAPSAALTDLYRTHRAELVRFARIRIRHASDAEDLVQDAFLAAARAYPDREARDLKPLLFTMVRNLSINYLKSGHTRRAKVSEPVEDQASRLACEATPSPEGLLATRQQLALIEAALASLPERRREALRLHRIERLSHKQIAARLGVSKPVITRALDTMGGLKLVARHRDETDRRNVLIARTVDGALFVERFGDAVIAQAKELPA